MRYTADERPVIEAAKRIQRAATKRTRKERPAKVVPERRSPPASAVRERQPRVREPKYLAYIRRLPCLDCALRGVIVYGVDAAHVRHSFGDPAWRYVGKAEKPDDARTLPACRTSHEAQHARGDEAAYWAERRIHPPAAVASLRTSYAAGVDGLAAVTRAIQDAQT